MQGLTAQVEGSFEGGLEDILDRADNLGTRDIQEDVDNTGCGGKRVEPGDNHKAGGGKEVVEGAGRWVASWAVAGPERLAAGRVLVPSWVGICRVAGFHLAALSTRVGG